jgi:type I restriction enzyme R subunit
MSEFSESVAEDATLAWLESLGWTAKYGPEIAPGELLQERAVA